MNKSVLVGSIGGVVLVAGVLLLSAGNHGRFFQYPGFDCGAGRNAVGDAGQSPGE